MAKSAAEVAAKERARVATVLQRRKADEEAAQRRAMRAIVTNVQLKDIAQAQVGGAQGGRWGGGAVDSAEKHAQGMEVVMGWKLSGAGRWAGEAWAVQWKDRLCRSMVFASVGLRSGDQPEDLRDQKYANDST